jgi:hypothetical protein
MVVRTMPRVGARTNTPLTGSTDDEPLAGKADGYG